MALAKPFKRWLLRLSRDETLPIVVAQRRIFIVPTRAGALYALVLAVMLLGAINYELSLGHALVFLLAGLGLVTMVHTLRNLLGLRLTPGRAEPVFAGELARFPLHLENSLGQTRRALDFSFAGGPVINVNLAAAAASSVAISCPAPRRGHLDPGPITLSTRYPLGLFRAWCYPHPHLSCLVYPQPIETPLPPTSGVAHHGQRYGSDGDEDFTGLRLRQANDSPRHIAWKAVARDIDQRPLLIKQFAGGAADELWLDWSATPADSTSETRLSLLAGWVLAAERQQARYGLRLPGRTQPPGLGRAHCNACLEALAVHGQA
jgi:uncharacterized protein (DUF58 family)